MNNAKTLYKQLQQDIPSLMESNINDDLNYDPWETNQNLREYITNEIFPEINSQREYHDIYSREELNKLEYTANHILKLIP